LKVQNEAHIIKFVTTRPDELINPMLEVFTLIAFVGAVTTVFCLFGALVFRLIKDQLGKRPSPLSRRDRIVLPLGITGIICVLYGLLIEPYWLSVEHVKLLSDKIPEGKSVRVIQLSDLHCDPNVRLERKLPAVVAAEKPDLIVFTGDAINSPAGLPIFRELMAKLAKIAPTYVVAGNWDTSFFKTSDRFTGTGVIELVHDPAMLTLRGIDLCIAGLPVDTRLKVSEVLKDVPERIYRIFLFHYPDFIEDMEHNKVDLYLAGHTHGGQVALPFYGALITASNRGKQFESGLHKLGNTYEYTNRGIGMEGGNAPRVRFLARPEVTVFDISGSKK
jgi:predicted MPP superfamily phosphohydrolase